MPESSPARAEQQFLSEAKVLVTSARFVVPKQTYAMANIASVKYVPPKRLSSYVIAAIGGIFCLIPAEVRVLGIITLLTGLVLASRAKGEVRIYSTGVESRAMWSSNTKLLRRIVDAVNQAIIARG